MAKNDIQGTKQCADCGARTGSGTKTCPGCGGTY